MGKQLYKITFLNLKTGLREVYMNNTGFSYSFAKLEIRRLKKVQDRYERIGFGRKRKDFKIEAIKLKKP